MPGRKEGIALQAPRCPTGRELLPEQPHIDDEHAMVKDLVVHQAHEVRIGIDSGAEPVNLPCCVESRQFLSETFVESVKIVE